LRPYAAFLKAIAGFGCDPGNTVARLLIGIECLPHRNIDREHAFSHTRREPYRLGVERLDLGPGLRKVRREAFGGIEMISALIGVLIIIVVGAICFWAIDKFATDRRLANLLKLLVILICLGAILQRVLPLAGIYY
jgi:hypothetical protein